MHFVCDGFSRFFPFPSTFAHTFDIVHAKSIHIPNDSIGKITTHRCVVGHAARTPRAQTKLLRNTFDDVENQYVLLCSLWIVNGKIEWMSKCFMCAAKAAAALSTLFSAIFVPSSCQQVNQWFGVVLWWWNKMKKRDGIFTAYTSVAWIVCVQSAHIENCSRCMLETGVCIEWVNELLWYSARTPSKDKILSTMFWFRFRTNESLGDLAKGHQGQRSSTLCPDYFLIWFAMRWIARILSHE